MTGINRAELEQINHFHSMLSENARKNTYIAHKDEFRNGCMLHIDAVTPKAFVPMMPRSAAPSEDNTVPRVTVAPTLLGCIIGYARVASDFSNKTFDGYDINRLDFEFGLVPNQKMVYDAQASGEFWLVGYTPQTKEYVPLKIGKLFLKSIVLERIPASERKKTKKNLPRLTRIVHAQMYCELTQPIAFDNDRDMQAGYWKITFTQDFDSDMSVAEKNQVELLEISAGEYAKVKNLTAATLSYKENTSALGLSHRW